MDIILLESLNKLGKAGEIVTVKDGFAKNFLIPQKKAIIANKKNKADLKDRITQINSNNDKRCVCIIIVFWKVHWYFEILLSIFFEIFGMTNAYS